METSWTTYSTAPVVQRLTEMADYFLDYTSASTRRRAGAVAVLDVIAATAAEALRAGRPCARARHRPGPVVVEATPENVRRFEEVNGPADRSTAGGTIQDERIP